MNRSRYDDGSTVQTGGLRTDKAQVLTAAGVTTAVGANMTVYISSESAVWVQIGPDVTAATAATAGNTLIPAGIFPFNLLSGDKIASTGAICVTPAK